MTPSFPAPYPAAPTTPPALAIYHEHPLWFRPLFAALERRGVLFGLLDARSHWFDAQATDAPYGLVFNRMSPSAHLRGAGHAIAYTGAFLAHLERLGVGVINGATAWGYETSKARQITLLESLGLPAPRTRVIHHIGQAADAAAGLRFPVVVKANVGGSGAGIVRFDTPADLAALPDDFDLGVDHTALVQEFVPRRDGRITRVETLNGKFLYAIHVYSDGDTFDLCPADICRTTDGAALESAAASHTAAKSQLTVEGYTPPAAVIAQVERMVGAAGIDVGGVEYMTDDRDGSIVYYDINALSNFVADAPRVVGFDPHDRLADYVAERLAR